jgi:hypothetical protein
MIDELLQFAGKSVLFPELKQIIRDIDFLDTKLDEWYFLPDKSLYEKGCLKKGALMAYRDKVLWHLEERISKE